MFASIKRTYNEYPRNFWTLVLAMFIDRIGGGLIFPFLALYLTQKFGVGMTEVGMMLLVHQSSAFVGNIIGGALTDRFGRKTMLIAGLVISASVALGMGLVQTWEAFYGLAFLTGFVSNIGGPAVSAMMADILPESQRAEGFGIYRVAFNLSATIAPAIGGVLAGVSYLLLFVLDCIISIITAVIVYIAIPETKPELAEGQSEKSVGQTLVGYGRVFQDRIFLAVTFFATLTAVVYIQMHTSMSVFLRSMHGVNAQGYGYILSLNAAMVVVMQFWITRKIKPVAPMVLMAWGNLLYALGFAMYGFVSQYWLFLAAMVIITVGEMVIAPVAQTLVANLAPADMRGRYMAFFGISWGAASAVGPLAAGIVIDNFNPNWVWYAGGLICSAAAVGYIWLNARAGKRFRRMPLPTVSQ